VNVILSGKTSDEDAMPNKQINGREPEFSEEDRQREKLGQRGVPGKASSANAPPQQEKSAPKHPDPGHTA